MDPERTALSLNQPWASLLINGEKSIEIRKWIPPTNLIGKRIIIHATQKVAVVNDVYSIALKYPQPTGCLLGSAVLTGFREYDQKYKWIIDSGKHMNPIGWWSENIYGWRFAEMKIFEQPIKCKGKQRFWSIPDDIIIPE